MSIHVLVVSVCMRAIFFYINNNYEFFFNYYKDVNEFGKERINLNQNFSLQLICSGVDLLTTIFCFSYSYVLFELLT